MSERPNSNTPEAFGDLRLKEPAEKAAGATAVIQSLKHVIGQSGALRGTQALARLNQKGGFDCPSCAWPDPDGRRSANEYCENGAKAVASETTRRRITRAFFREHSVVDLANRSDLWHEQQGRLTEPVVLIKGATHYEPISWPEAFALIGDTLKGFNDPNQAIFYTSGRTSNEAAFLYQLFVRMYGTNNLPDCSNMCHESSGVAMGESIGVGKGTVSMDDIHNAQLLLIAGQNPGTNHPRMLSSLQIAKENGARIVSINPLQETGLKAFAHPQRVSQILGGKTSIADDFVCPKINGDQALFKGMAKRIFEKAADDPSLLDRAFIETHAAGFDGYAAHIAETDWGELTRLSGVTRVQMEMLGDAFCANERIITCWAMGLTQHRNGVATIQEIANLHFLRGAIGKPGAGLCPVRGHSNVQGDRTMGIYEAMPAVFLDRLGSVFGFEAPREVGHHTVGAIRAMHSGDAKLFVGMGGNFLSATPDTNYTAEALRSCDLTVQVSTKLNRSHLITGKQALILPCLGRSETDEQAGGRQWITVENSMGVVSKSEGRLTPASEDLKSEVAIVCGMARASLPPNSKVDWEAFESDYSLIRDKIEEVVPGFENFNERAAQPGGFYLYNAAKERKFNTETEKANFTVNALDIEQPQPGKLLLMTVRSHDQYNTTIYGLHDRYRGIHGERRVILMGREDIEELGLQAEQVVDVSSHFGGETRTVRKFLVIPYDIPRYCAAMYFPEANPLVPLNHTARRSETPASKSIQITVVLSG